jgi:hypothetical protein
MTWPEVITARSRNGSSAECVFLALTLLGKELVDSWGSGSSSSTSGSSFTADGHFTDAAAAAMGPYRESTHSPNLLERDVVSAASAGVYKVHGDRLTKTYSGGPQARKPETTLFSIVRATWPPPAIQTKTLLRTVESYDGRIEVAASRSKSEEKPRSESPRQRMGDTEVT